MAKSGVKIKDAPWRQIRRRVLEIAARDRSVKVGVMAAAGASSELLTIAAVHEFGSPSRNIPQRSWLRSTFRDKRGELDRMVVRVARLIIQGKLNVDRGLGLLGTWAAAAVKATIASGPHIPPPLKPETIARKGSDRPLVDTGQLVNSITYVITEK